MTPPACLQTRTFPPSPACSRPTLSLSHYLTPIKYDWITQESFHQLVYSGFLFLFFLQREHYFFLLRSYSVSLLSGSHALALPSHFLIFFLPSNPTFLRGCFTKLNTVYFGRDMHCKKGMFGRRQVGQVCVNVWAHSRWLTLARDGGGGLTGRGLWEHTASTLVPLTRTTRPADGCYSLWTVQQLYSNHCELTLQCTFCY